MEAECSIQWKETDACLDITCECGKRFHRDGFYLRLVTCDDCGAWYKLGYEVEITKATAAEVKDAGHE